MVNKVILVGNVGADPEIRTLEGGNKVARFNLATTEKIYNPVTKESREHTEWHNITLWRGLAEVTERFVRKGSQVYVEGKIRSRQWEDEATHTKRYAMEIVVDELKLLGKREANPNYNQNQGQSYSQPQNNQHNIQTTSPAQTDVAASDIDDLPF